jgi:hypothetical protein
LSAARLPAAVVTATVVALVTAGGGRLGAAHYVRQLVFGPAGPGTLQGARPASHAAFPPIPRVCPPARAP